jgi:hypothetical protein
MRGAGAVFVSGMTRSLSENGTDRAVCSSRADSVSRAGKLLKLPGGVRGVCEATEGGVDGVCKGTGAGKDWSALAGLDRSEEQAAIASAASFAAF